MSQTDIREAAGNGPGPGRPFQGAAKSALPLALGVASYGLVFGILARQAGLDLGQGLFMSLWVFAGSSQFIALEMWNGVVPVTALIVTTLVVNLRHLLMGAALAPRLNRLSPAKRLLTVFFVADENWALTMSRTTGKPDPDGNLTFAWLVGGGIVMYSGWVGSTLVGFCFGSFVQDPARWGLDFAFTAAFIALLTGFWRGKSDLLPWAVAAAVALACHHWLPGKWYILAGGLAGSLAGAGWKEKPRGA